MRLWATANYCRAGIKSLRGTVRKCNIGGEGNGLKGTSKRVGEGERRMCGQVTGQEGREGNVLKGRRGGDGNVEER